MITLVYFMFICFEKTHRTMTTIQIHQRGLIFKMNRFHQIWKT